MTIDMTTRSHIETQEVVIEAAVTDAPPRPIYEGSRTMWRPTSIRVRWTRDRRDGGPWWHWSADARIDGPKLLKSGLSSPTQTHSARYVSPRDPEFGDWIESTRPGADLPDPIPAAL
jgi:hypothetical protein